MSSVDKRAVKPVRESSPPPRAPHSKIADMSDNGVANDDEEEEDHAPKNFPPGI